MKERHKEQITDGSPTHPKNAQNSTQTHTIHGCHKLSKTKEMDKRNLPKPVVAALHTTTAANSLLLLTTNLRQPQKERRNEGER